MRSFLFAAILVLPMPVAAQSAFSFDFDTGIGFVPKSVILQSDLGVNNGQLRKVAGDVTFSVVERRTVEVICETGPNSEAVLESGSGVASELLIARNQVTGFDLEGFAEPFWVADPDPSEFCSGPGSASFGDVLEIETTLSAELGNRTAVILGQMQIP